MRAVQITLLFVAVMLWLGVQAAQTEPTKPSGAASQQNPIQPIALVGAD